MIEIWSKPACPACDQAKAFIEAYHVPFIVKELNEDFTMEELKARAPDAKSFPQIFDGENLVGSLNDLVRRGIIIDANTH